jgi:hypothetical protein
MPYGSNSSSRAASFAGLPTASTGDHLGGQVDRLGAEQADDLDQLAAGLGGGLDLDQDQLAPDASSGRARRS